MNQLKVAIIGCGQRGKDIYGKLLATMFQEVKVVGVAEPITKRREEIVSWHEVNERYVFSSYEQLLAEEKFCDAVIICTNDDLHFEPAKMALEKGYHVMLEKPMVNNEEDLLKLQKLATQYENQVFMICHVLRYTPFFTKIKALIEEGAIGRLMTVQHNENIGYYHMAHSFVRGNWRNSDETSPIILAKSCHDLDILNFLVGGRCTHIASFGELSHFKADQRPLGSSDRCLTCDKEIEAACPYSALKLYLKNGGHWASVITEQVDEEGIHEALMSGPYGRCVYECDNNVADHQATVLTYDNGVSVTFNLSAFTHDITRTLKIMGSHGEIRAHMGTNEVVLHTFNSGETKTYYPLESSEGHVGHGGGDSRLLEDFIKAVSYAKEGIAYCPKTTALESIQSHMMAFAAEHARLEKVVVSLD